MAISAEPKSQNLTERPLPAKLAAAETTAKIIEFPRSAAPPRPLDELAEPVLDRPRILEAPEIVPAGPALGGILIEAAEEEPAERRPGFEIPLQAARLTRRIGAGATDFLIVCMALSGFGYVFFRIAAIVPPLTQAAGWGMFIAGVFWVAYQYLFLVHAGTTPGLKIMKLRLSRFDGKPGRDCPSDWVLPGACWMRTNFAGMIASPTHIWRQNHDARSRLTPAA